MTVSVVSASREAKLERARAVLFQAERAAGLSASTVPRVQVTRGATALAAVPDQPHPVEPMAPGSAWEVLPALSPFFPYGIGGGQLIEISGSRSLLLSLVGHISRQGGWTAFVGMPDVGWDSAANYGLDLAATVSVPAPGRNSAGVISALIDGFDVLVLGDLPLSTHDQRMIVHRARTRGIVLMTESWPNARIKLTVSEHEPHGYSAGVGHLDSWSGVVSARMPGAEARRVTWDAATVTEASAVPRLRVVPS